MIVWVQIIAEVTASLSLPHLSFWMRNLSQFLSHPAIPFTFSFSGGHNLSHLSLSTISFTFSFSLTFLTILTRPECNCL